MSGLAHPPQPAETVRTVLNLLKPRDEYLNLLPEESRKKVLDGYRMAEKDPIGFLEFLVEMMSEIEPKRVKTILIRGGDPYSRLAEYIEDLTRKNANAYIDEVKLSLFYLYGSGVRNRDELVKVCGKHYSALRRILWRTEGRRVVKNYFEARSKPLFAFQTGLIIDYFNEKKKELARPLVKEIVSELTKAVYRTGLLLPILEENRYIIGGKEELEKMPSQIVELPEGYTIKGRLLHGTEYEVEIRGPDRTSMSWRIDLWPNIRGFWVESAIRDAVDKLVKNYAEENGYDLVLSKWTGDKTEYHFVKFLSDGQVMFDTKIMGSEEAMKRIEQYSVTITGNYTPTVKTLYANPVFRVEEVKELGQGGGVRRWILYGGKRYDPVMALSFKDALLSVETDEEFTRHYRFLKEIALSENVPKEIRETAGVVAVRSLVERTVARVSRELGLDSVVHDEMRGELVIISKSYYYMVVVAPNMGKLEGQISNVAGNLSIERITPPEINLVMLVSHSSSISAIVEELSKKGYKARAVPGAPIIEVDATGLSPEKIVDLTRFAEGTLLYVYRLGIADKTYAVNPVLVAVLNRLAEENPVEYMLIHSKYYRYLVIRLDTGTVIGIEL